MKKHISIILLLFLNTILFCLDTDNDGYSDKEEKKAGSNFQDASSVIYTGFWPYNINKNKITDPGFGECPKAMGCECTNNENCPENSKCEKLYIGQYCIPLPGARVPRFIGIDQFGEEFDLYDLAGQGKPILIEISTPWPRATKAVSSWRSYTDDRIKNEQWWKDNYNKVRDLVDNDEVYWVHIMHLNENKEIIAQETISDWYNTYPNERIIILSDPEAMMKTWVRPTGYPSIILIDEDMNLLVHTLRGIEDAFYGLYKLLGIKY